MTTVLAKYNVVRHGEMTFSEESMRDVFNDPDFDSLLSQNGEELNGALGYEVDIDRPRYLALAGEQVTKMFTIRRAGTLVGYANYYLGENPQARGTTRAVQDALFIRKDCRPGGVAMKFIDYCCDQLGKQDVNVVYQVCNVKRDFGRALRQMGFREVEHVYARSLR